MVVALQVGGLDNGVLDFLVFHREAALLRLMFQLGDEPSAVPKLHGMAVN